MKKGLFGILLMCMYCFPFVFFSMYKDFEKGSMVGYLVMIVATSILSFIGGFKRITYAIFIGNIVSAIVSFFFIERMEDTLGIGWDGGFFAPFSPEQLLIFNSLMILIPQYFALKSGKRFKNTI